MKNNFYDNSYYKNNYVSPLHMRFRLANLYYLWLAFFCFILPAKLKKGDKTLDVGCGIGNLVWALRKFKIDAYGIEPSVAAKKFSVAPKYCIYTSYNSLPYKNKSFDLVYTNEVLEHIEEKELDKNLKEMLRVSKNGNIINIIGVEERGLMITEEPSHVTVHNEDWWEKKFTNFKFITRKGNLFYIFPHIIPGKTNILSLKKGYFFLIHKPR